MLCSSGCVFNMCFSLSATKRTCSKACHRFSLKKKKKKKSLNPAILCRFFTLCGPLWVVSFDSFLGGYERLMQQKHLQQFLKCGVKQLWGDNRTVLRSHKANRYTCCHSFLSRLVTAMAIRINSCLMRLQYSCFFWPMSYEQLTCSAYLYIYCMYIENSITYLNAY